MKENLPYLIIGRGASEYKIEVPIFQGGMSTRVSTADLASAVANCGGAGVIGGVGMGFGLEEYKHLSAREADRQALQDELKKAKKFSPNGIYGVNLLVAVTDYNKLVNVSIENGAKFIVSGAGLPLNLPELTVNHPEVALIPIVSSTQALSIICRKWEKKYNRLPDAVIVEGPGKAGGHLGATYEHIYDDNLKLENVIPESRRWMKQYGEENNLNLDFPLIAAGGIWDRVDINNMLSLGANGVQMATRFVCTNECEASVEFKQKYLNCKKEDITIIKSPVGLPGRAIRTNFLDKLEKGEVNDRCLASCLQRCSLRDNDTYYCIIGALNKSHNGDVENGIVFAGSNAWRAKEKGIISVRQVFDELI